MEDSVQEGNVVIIKVDDLKDVHARGRGTPKNVSCQEVSLKT